MHIRGLIDVKYSKKTSTYQLEAIRRGFLNRADDFEIIVAQMFEKLEFTVIE
jgi:hypothetical protein